MAHDDPADDPDDPESGGESTRDEQAANGRADEEASLSATAYPKPIEPPTEPGAVEAYLQRARLAEDRLAEVLAAYRKLKLDNEGFRERTTRNIERRYHQRREKLLLNFIEILDNLDRALDAAERSSAGEPLIEGLILVRTQLLQTLQEEGLERVPVLGLPYDPNVSEAVGTASVEDAEMDHVVVKEMMRGYRLNGRVARASRVIVGQHTQHATAAGQPVPEQTSQGSEADEETGTAATSAESLEEPPLPPSETPGEPSLEEIIARAEAQDQPPAPVSKGRPAKAPRS